MALQSTVVGSYPKPPEEGGSFALRKTLQAWQRGEVGEAELAGARRDLAREIIAEQEAAGIDLVTDGHVWWDDILTPFAGNMAGLEIGGLLRWFDNNVYYRRPVCVDEIEWRGPSSIEAWRFAQSVAGGPVKAVIPGPVTFARLSVDEHYGDHGRFVEAIASVLAQEAFELEAAGARFIQIDEPALLGAPEDLELAKRAIGQVSGQLEAATTILCTYFGDAKRLGAELFELPVDSFGLDFVAGPDNRELIASLPAGLGLQAGVVDARNTRLETTDEVAATIDDLASGVGADNLTVSPSAGLEFLPRDKAKAKLERLAQAAARVQG